MKNRQTEGQKNTTIGKWTYKTYYKIILSKFVIMNNRDKILNRIIGIVDKTAPGAEIYLYGSRARGDAKRLSDWDILILLDSKNISFDLETKFMNELYEVELETGEIISPLIYTISDWNKRRSITPLYENIKKEGVKLR